MLDRKLFKTGLVAGMLGLGGTWGSGPLQAEEPAAEPQSLEEAFKNGKIDLTFRLRFEHVHSTTAAEDAHAETLRTRFGYQTAPFKNWIGYIQFEDVTAFDDDRYNAAGQNNNAGKDVIADPEDTEVNQAFLRYAPMGWQATGGRQKITLDDHRFVGDVGWRQNEQTFDAGSMKYQLGDKMDFFYGYLWDVNRIFGPDSGLDFESDSHLLNLSAKNVFSGTLVGFAYLLDFDNSAADSSDTYGARWTGNLTLSEKIKLKTTLSYAHQTDAGDNPTDYSTDYYFAEIALPIDTASVGLGYELQGSDDGVFGFRTPLGTNHKFNGWADQFLTTPATGLQDLYVFTSLKGPDKITCDLFYHWFESDEGSDDQGLEFDAQVKKPLTKHSSILIKYANFDGKSGRPDVEKFWIQWEWTY